MKPPVFDYHAPATLREALTLLQEIGEEARVLAGGQSLVPLLNMRIVRPSVLIDLNRVGELFTVSLSDGGALSLEAMVRHRTLERDPLIRTHAPLLSEAAAFIGHLQIRSRGTLGGSLAHADPAAELPPVVVALGARIEVRSARAGARLLPAQEFFVGPLTTALAPDELLVGVRIPRLPPKTGWAFVELARRHGDFAIVGAAALVHLDRGGRVDMARLALCGVGGVPFSPQWFEEMLLGERPGRDLFREVGRRIQEAVEPDGDMHAGPTYRRRMAGLISARALAAAVERTARGHGVAAPH